MSDERLLEALAARGLELPNHCAPRGGFCRGRVPVGPSTSRDKFANGMARSCTTGSVGVSISIDDGIKAAQMCALNLLFHLRAACGGNLARVTRCLRVGAFVNAPPGFLHSPKIANGASDIFIALWGEAGRHARTAVGVSALPMDASVEVDAIFEAEEE